MTANGTAQAPILGAVSDQRSPTKAPTLTIDGQVWECRDVSALTYNEQIQANHLIDSLEDIEQIIRDYQESYDDEDDEWGEIPEAPPEVEARWRRHLKRVVRFGFPEIPRSELEKLTPGDVAQASSKFLRYLVQYGLEVQSDEQGSGDQGGKDKPAGNRKQRRASQKQSRT